MNRIIATDLDGTLLNSSNKITEYTKKIINLLIKNNIFVLASGRHYLDVEKVRNFLNIKSFMITSNGARVYDLNNKLIFKNDLEEAVTLDLCNIVYTDTDIITQVYQRNRWYINNNKLENNFCPSLTSLQYTYLDLKKFNYSKVNKVFFTSKNFQKLYELKKKIMDVWGAKVNVHFSVPGCLEVVSGKTSKGHGLTLISKLLGISLNRFIAFGDGMNDRDMLSIVGKSYIMQNADLHLKNLLPHVCIIKSNDEDGVAQCLHDIFIQNNKII
ncbi:Cof-type HAD-IIB family hydrolase [Buchnera aphidicola (Hyadaphis tataricae)]|uniref:Cof-type HAD-IIB family hydrolase n=1 Tax=Buchnera aphidicola (Hyadaphis tataricae) TaxID=1241859 RepID=A0A4D6XUA5_9GAMM|nr:Cof-type HAD-IIB family hydrolase [Buchnera aphidicola]QCI21362.1 Cof-type HAD-IIB family hydrolase [Buchnera aphidicola (Hyadaphis tataricae)]